MSEQLDHSPFYGWEMHEIGNGVQILGVMIGDHEKEFRMYLPGEEARSMYRVENPTPEEWQKWLLATDDPKFAERDPSGVLKAIHRKVTRHVDQEMMWETYRRDSFTCQYCGVKDRAMTYDHWEPQSLGGPTTVDNGVTACRPCNKRKGHMSTDDWKKYMKEKGLNGPRAQAA